MKRLSRLVKSMLDLSRIDSGEMKLHPSRFDITNTVVTTLLTFEQKIDEKQIEIRGLKLPPKRCGATRTCCIRWCTT